MLNRLRSILAILGRAFHGPADPTASVFPLERRTADRIDFDTLTKGIDNIHIDVRLSPQFTNRTRWLVAQLLDQQVSGGRAATPAMGPGRREWEGFRAAYAGLLEAAIHRAKALDQPILVPLAQLAVRKFLLTLVQTELELRRQGLRAALSATIGTREREKLEITERLSWLARNRTRLRYNLNRQLIEQLVQVESGTIATLRAGLLGDRGALPEEILWNPLLHAESPSDEEVLLKEYVLLAQDQGHPYSFAAMEGFLPYLFRRRSPVHEVEIALASAERAQKEALEELNRHRKRSGRVGGAGGNELPELRQKVDQAEARLRQARAAYCELFYSWAEAPANVDILFNRKLFREHLRKARKKKDSDAIPKLKAQLAIQRRLVRIVEQRFHEHDLLRDVVASYEAASLYRDYSSVLAPQELRKVLSGESDYRELLHRMKARSTGKPLRIETLIQAQRRIARMSRRERGDHLVAFLRDFVKYRRDLRCRRAAQEAMERIHIQEDPEHIRLSRANHTLYEFLAPEEGEGAAQMIVSHVVLKADVRGSTTVIKEFRNRGLNPASHFGLNFFAPIQELADLFGAKTVFLEGDAIILSLFQYEGQAGLPIVARACGLAKELLGVVDRQNASLLKNGLPELEVGIGIVWDHEQPSFLYAGDTPIMVSAAIGKADRLSSCSWLLRKQRSRQQTVPHVEVYELPASDPLRGEKGEIHIRYNVNGIELDAEGFRKLQSEIVLERLKVSLPGAKAPSVVYAGRYPDLKGNLHQLVIREEVIRFFDRHDPGGGEPTADKFYEVIANQDLLGAVDEAIRAARSATSVPQ